ncbi:MAG: redoxin domain-containing protein [Brevinematales bacterium]|nr:redoxin domain-containing protein [Brevinematales bacterium]
MQTIFDQKKLNKGAVMFIAFTVLLIGGIVFSSLINSEGDKQDDSDNNSLTADQVQVTKVVPEAPEFSATDVKLGKEISLARFAKMDVILYFWDPSDTKQSARIERLIEIQKAMMGKVAVIGVARTDDADAVKSFIKDNKINFPVILSTAEMETGYMADPGNSYCALIGLDRTLLKTYTGVIDINGLTSHIEKDMK